MIFTASAVGCGIAGTLWGLIAIRAVQGLGAGLLLVSSLALLVGLAGSRRLALLLVVPLLRMRRRDGEARQRPGKNGLVALAAVGVVAVGS